MDVRSKETGETYILVQDKGHLLVVEDNQEVTFEVLAKCFTSANGRFGDLAHERAEMTRPGASHDDVKTLSDLLIEALRTEIAENDGSEVQVLLSKAAELLSWAEAAAYGEESKRARAVVRTPLYPAVDGRS